MKKIIISTVLTLMLLFCATPVYAGIPALPHAFYGSVTINGDPAPDGTKISATTSQGSIVAIQNPVPTKGGSYGLGSPHLLVQGDITKGATISFYVDGIEAEGQTDTYEIGGGPTERPLSVTIEPEPEPEPEPSGGGGLAQSPVETNLFGVEGRLKISRTGIIRETIEATSEDGKLTLTIPKGTKALDKDGDPLEVLEAAIDESPPDPPVDANIIGLAYNFGPAGATFDPLITLEYTYDPANIPEGVAEEDLVIAYYDEEAGEWVELDCVVDTENNTITASVSHFTTFAVIARVPVPVAVPPVPVPAAFSLSNLTIQPAEVEPEEQVTITVSVANTGGTEGSYSVVLKINGVQEAEKSLTIAAGKSQDVSFSIAKEETGSYSVVVDGVTGSFVVVAPVPPPPAAPPAPPPEVKPPIPWPIVGAIIGVVVVGLLIFFVVRRRAY